MQDWKKKKKKNPTAKHLSKCPQLIAYGSLYRSKVKQHSKWNQRPPPPPQSIYRASPQIDDVSIAVLSHCKSQGGEVWCQGCCWCKTEKKTWLLLLSKAKGDVREGCSCSAADWGSKIWLKKRKKKKRNLTNPSPARTAKMRHLRKRKGRKEEHMRLVLVPLHHLAFLRHVEIPTTSKPAASQSAGRWETVHTSCCRTNHKKKVFCEGGGDYIHIEGLILRLFFLLSMMRNTEQVWLRTKRWAGAAASEQSARSVLLLHFLNAVRFVSPQNVTAEGSNHQYSADPAARRPNHPAFSHVDHQIMSLELLNS